MSRHVYQLEGQQLRGLLHRARIIRTVLTGSGTANPLLALHEAIRDATQIEYLLTEYLEQPTVQVDD